MFRSQKSPVAHKKAFTIVELLISVGIFALMTALVMVKYSNFNSSVLLTNTAYDVALAIRTAQTYGLSAKRDTSGNFDKAYGIYFNDDPSISSVSGLPINQTIIFFSDLNVNDIYDSGEELSFFLIKGGAYIGAMNNVCIVPTNCNPGGLELNIVFRRPNPDAIICPTISAVSTGNCGTVLKSYIIIVTPTGDSRIISVMNNGQISVDPVSL